MIIGDDDHVALSAAAKLAAVGQAAIVMARIGTFRAKAGLEGEARPQDWVVHEMPPDGSRIMQHGNAQGSQCSRGANAAAHQNAGAMDGAGAKHDLMRADILKGTSAEARAHTNSAAPFEDNAIHQRIATNGQVRAPQFASGMRQTGMRPPWRLPDTP